jgi:hypothetical protein
MVRVMQTASNWNNECDPLKDLETISKIMLEEVGYKQNLVYENLTLVKMFATGELNEAGGKKTLTLSFKPDRLRAPIETIATNLQNEYPGLFIKPESGSLVIEGPSWYDMLEAIATIADYIKL